MNIAHRRLSAGLLIAALPALVGMSAGFNTPAPQQKSSACPKTEVQCPDSIHKGETLKITALVKGGDEQVTPTYNWSVSAGAIASGQGMATIEVDLKEVAADSTVTATVEVGGYDRECGYGSTVSSCTTIVEKK
jgi:hypothetical protein